MQPRRSGARASPCARVWARWRVVLAAGALVAAGCADTASKAKVHSVAIQSFQYTPAALTVTVGDTVVWTNEDVVPHTATAADNAWDTGSMGVKATGRAVIDRKGMHRYVCAFHPNMMAEVVAR